MNLPRSILEGDLRSSWGQTVHIAKRTAITLTFVLAVGAAAQTTASAPSAQPSAPEIIQPTPETATLPVTPAQKMAATVIQQWPVGPANKSVWGYELGFLLDGMAAEWHTTADGVDFAYIKSIVDQYVTAGGTITGYKANGHTLDDIEMGRAILLCYRVTQQAKYAKAAQFLHQQLAMQPRTPSGGFWHKQIYPNQMWLDGAYMAEPFRAEYAVTFQTPEDFDDIAKQLLLMYDHMRDPRTGLLRHGWDESKQMPWADETTGLSPEAWGRAMGWYIMALVDVLDNFPLDHPQRPALLAAFKSTMASALRYQDLHTALWWQVMDLGDRQGSPGNIKLAPGQTVDGKAAPGNYLEASASCMFTYALAKGVRMGYLPFINEANARHAWQGIETHFIATHPDGTLTLHGTVKVGGLGGTPYRSGTFDYYISEPVVDQDKKGVAAFLLAGSEMEQAPTESDGQGNTALVDAWFNSQTRKTALGQTELYHYKWSDDSDNGYSFFGHAFERYGVRLAQLPAAPTRAALAHAQIYVIASPDIPTKNPNPHYVDKPSGDAIEAWVKAGGVLLLFSNDRDNTEFEHFNTLSDRFGIHFNPVLSHHAVGNDHASGEVVIPPNTPGFGLQPGGFTAYMKDTSTITATGAAHPLVTSNGDVMIAIAHVGKGAVMGIVDPWFYNEYADGRKMRQYDGFESALDIAAWAVNQSH
jgi:unsaturated rhamnogalacturonyl hydrolase